MNRIKLLHNPRAGNGKFLTYLDHTCEILTNGGYSVDVYEVIDIKDFTTFLSMESCRDISAVVIAGGDGSVNLVVNAMLRAGLDIPLGILPAGTANDFATHLGMPLDLRAAAEVLCQMQIRPIDIAQVNGHYFINVCGGGVFTDISYRIDRKKKRLLGKAAYYIQGLIDLPKLRGMKLRILAPDVHLDLIDDFYIFLVCNGSNIGGFPNLASGAKADDGLFDFIALRVILPTQIPVVAVKILSGEHLKDDRFVHFQASHMTIERLDNNNTYLNTVIDGEKGPDYPLHISVLPGRLRLLGP